MNVDASLDLVILEALDWEPGCEGWGHSNGDSGHVLAAPAAFLIIAPCGVGILKCAGNAAWLRTFEGLACEACGGRHKTTDMRFLPLAES